jgi:hypothetical protein
VSSGAATPLCSGHSQIGSLDVRPPYGCVEPPPWRGCVVLLPFRGIVTAVDRRAAELLQGRSIEGWIRNDNGNGSYDVQKSFINQFMAADKMYVLFPDGSEPTWTMNMDGSEKIARAFIRCINQ